MMASPPLETRPSVPTCLRCGRLIGVVTEAPLESNPNVVCCSAVTSCFAAHTLARIRVHKCVPQNVLCCQML